MTLTHTICLALSYLLGAVPFGYLAGRLNGVNIRELGSGNIGATNVLRCLGKGWGALVFALDFGKGWLPTFGAARVFATMAGAEAPDWLPLACGLAAVLGHSYPVFLGFRGGKGVATSGGMLAGLTPWGMLAALAGWFLLFAVTRYVSVASMGAGLIVAAAGWTLHRSEGWLIPMALTALAALIIWRHRSNIERLLKGEEHRFHFRGSSPAPTAPQESRPPEEE